MRKIQQGVLALLLVVLSSVALVACGGDISKKLTAENFNAIVITTAGTNAVEGDTFAAVKKRLGNPTGEKKELVDNAGVFEWATKDAKKKITVTFNDGKASAKSQVGVLENTPTPTE